MAVSELTMADGRFALDTNIIIFLFRGDEQLAIHFKQAKADLFISTIVIGELLYGAKHSRNVKKNVKRIEDFLARCTVVRCDEVTADYYGTIKSYLHQNGTQVPDNDIWIAASAAQHQVPVITRDIHFDSIPQIESIRW